MGIFRTNIEISPWPGHERRAVLQDVMVDTGSEFTWIPAEVLHDLGVTPVRVERFESADGRILEREIGHAMIFTAGRSTPTIVTFADAGDLVLLGALTLEGLNMRVDLGRKELVPAGPVPVAAGIGVVMASSPPERVLPWAARSASRRLACDRPSGRA